MGNRKKRATFVTHGETNFLKERRLMGRRNDEPLNEKGRSQALEL